jgi:hypothetical protein
MGQRESKQVDQARYCNPSHSSGNTHYDSYSQQSNNREKHIREQEKMRKQKKKSKMNGIVAAAAGSA